MSEPLGKKAAAAVMSCLVPVYALAMVFALAAIVPLLVFGAAVGSWPAVTGAAVAAIFGARGVALVLGQANGAAAATVGQVLAQARAMAGAREQG